VEADLLTEDATVPDLGHGGSAIVTVASVTARSWRQATDLEVREEQRAFVAPVSYYLAMCAYDDGLWRPLVVSERSAVVGFVMEAVDPGDASYWIGGLVIDSGSQGRGLGRATMEAMLARARAASYPSAALSYHPDNVQARQLYASLGFVETGEVDGHEGISRLGL
jgi:diamine N-acetyltransferase